MLLVVAGGALPALGQEAIHPLPDHVEQSPDVSHEQVLAAVDTMHAFAESLHAARKLATPAPDTVAMQQERWPEGSWGRGYYTQRVDYNPGRFQRYYTQWYGAGGGHPESCKPLVRDTGRRMLAYLRIQAAPEEVRQQYPILEERILDGARYLLGEQQRGGGFTWWYLRAGLQNCAPAPESSTNIYSSSIALRALAQTYTYLQQEYPDEQLDIEYHLAVAIRQASSYLRTRRSLFRLEAPSNNTNYRALAIWALAGAYEATGHRGHLRAALRLARMVIEMQQPDGVWFAPPGPGHDQWADSEIDYHGIILRGMAALGGVLPDHRNPALSSRIRQSILSGINHVIDYNGVASDRQVTADSEATDGQSSSGQSSDAAARSPSRTRISGANVYYKHHRGHRQEGRHDMTEWSAYLLQGLVYSREALSLSPESTRRLDALIQHSTLGIVRRVRSSWSPSPDAAPTDSVLYTAKFKGADATTLTLGVSVLGRSPNTLFQGKEHFNRP
jgi:hypothetical protein